MVNFTDFNGSKFITSPYLSQVDGLKHTFTTKLKGVSFDRNELNLGFSCEENKENVLQNFKTVSDFLDIDVKSIVLPNQVHKNNIRIVTKDDCGKGIFVKSDILETDALITNEKGVTLCAFYADCVPILLYDPKRKVISSVHAGWRGTINQILKKDIEVFEEVYHSNPSDIIAVIGPSIGPCHFEVGAEVKDEFIGAFGEHANELILQKNDRTYIDLWKSNLLILKNKGLTSISSLNLCTYCNQELFYSFRRDQEKTGRMAAFICLT